MHVYISEALYVPVPILGTGIGYTYAHGQCIVSFPYPRGAIEKELRLKDPGSQLKSHFYVGAERPRRDCVAFPGSCGLVYRKYASQFALLISYFSTYVSVLLGRSLAIYI